MNRIYVADINNIIDKEAFDYWYNQMPSRRQAKIDAYKPQKSKLLSLAAGILVKKALENEGILNYEFREGSAGKPYIIGYDNVFFNLSHSGEKAIIAVSDGEVGIDIEKNKDFNRSLAEFVFDENERAIVESLSDDKSKLYTALWTAKESIMKFYGKGISMEPKKIHLDIDSECNIKIRHVEGEYDFDKLYLLHRELGDYQITVCSKGDNFGKTAITDVFDRCQ